MTTLAFVLASWTPNAPAGMERATAAHAVGLAETGHQAVIVTAAIDHPLQYGGVTVLPLRTLPLSLPCDDVTLRAAQDDHASEIRAELIRLYDRHHVDVAVYVDALWGLGRIAPTTSPHRRVLAAHIIGHDIDLQTALAAQPDAVIVPSATVGHLATARGYDTSRWHVVANPILIEHPPPRPARRTELRHAGPVRLLARLSPVKGVHELLTAIPPDWTRPVQVALAEAGFEATVGEQDHYLTHCRAAIAARSVVTLRTGLSWFTVPRWLADAAVVIVPSRRETFGLVALEAMAVATPVIAYAVDHLPHLIGDGGVLIPPGDHPDQIWRAAADLLTDPVRYEATSRAAYYRTRDYRPAHTADQLLKVVS